ncbi:MAG: PDZ domain-containing protein [Planctomycetaceae bacterium]|nr:PDZ domain-containing protein [Planctomycetaceae bacterium]
MRRWMWVWLIALGIVLCMSAQGFCAEPPPTSPVEPKPAPVELPTDGENANTDEKPLSKAEIRELIQLLASDSFETREWATRRLEQAGAGAVALLSQAAEAGSLEITCRTVRALAGIVQRGDRATFEAAQIELERLAESQSRAAARRARATLAGLVETRRRHALERVIELGAIVKARLVPKALMGGDDENFGVRQLVLNKRWKGGDEGLVHFRRLDQLETLYVTTGAGISKEAIAQLEQAMPGLRVQPRGDAMLGVSCRSDGKNCVVETIAAGTAAEKCGLEEGDVIIKYGGKEIAAFEELIEITKDHSAGDKIKLEINRDGQAITLEATLGDWQ